MVTIITTHNNNNHSHNHIIIIIMMIAITRTCRYACGCARGYDDSGPQLFQVDPSGSYFGWKAPPFLYFLHKISYIYIYIHTYIRICIYIYIHISSIFLSTFRPLRLVLWMESPATPFEAARCYSRCSDGRRICSTVLLGYCKLAKHSVEQRNAA